MVIIEKYYRHSGSVVNTQREFRREVGRHHGFSTQAIHYTAVAASIEQDPDTSIRRRLAEVGKARESPRLILRLNLGLHLSKVVLTQELRQDNAVG